MDNNQETSLLFKYSFLAFFIFITFSTFIWFSFNTVDLFKQLISHNVDITFDKGSFYLLGVSIILSALLFNMVYEGLMKKDLTKTIAKRITRTALAGAALIILAPQIAHYTVQHYLEGNNYYICEQASSRWLMYRKIVYVTNDETCVELSEIKKMRHRKTINNR